MEGPEIEEIHVQLKDIKKDVSNHWTHIRVVEELLKRQDKILWLLLTGMVAVVWKVLF